MGGRCVGTGGDMLPRFLEANVKSLIFTIDAPQIFMPSLAYEYCNSLNLWQMTKFVFNVDKD